MEIIILPNGHVELPHELCRRMGIDAGTRFDVDIDERQGIITLKPVSREYYSVVHKRGRNKVRRPVKSRQPRTKTR